MKILWYIRNIIIIMVLINFYGVGAVFLRIWIFEVHYPILGKNWSGTVLIYGNY